MTPSAADFSRPYPFGDVRIYKKTSTLSVIASKAKQSRPELRISGLVWVALLSLAMTTSSILYSLTTP
jgi:hypothetical protein